MSIPQSASGPIQSRDDLVHHLSRGCRPRADWSIGTEHEKFVYDLKTHKPVAYDGKPGIRQLLEGMQRFGWEPVREGGNIIGLTQNGASLSAGARRPVSNCPAPGENHSRDLRRDQHPSRPDPRSGQRDWRRRAGLRLRALLVAGRKCR